MKRIGSVAFLLSMLLFSGTVGGAQVPPRDQAVYIDKTLLDREKQEAEARDRYLADRKGTSYKQAEEPTGKRLSMDFSKIDRPHATTEFKPIWHFPPKRQWWTNTCWSFSTTSFLESEIKRIHNREIKLSEMWSVYWEYVEKTKEFVRTKGGSKVEEGSESEAVLLRWKQYGIVRESDYTGLLPGQTFFMHKLLIEEIQAYLDFVKKNQLWEEADVIAHLRLILDKHMGCPPEKIRVDGRDLTPPEFLEQVVRLNLDNYVTFMSLTHAPFYTKAEYPVPDNWWHSKEYYNLPLEEFYAALKGAVTAGYSAAIGGDVTEPGYEGAEDLAIVPSFDIPQDYIDQSAREFRFSNKTTDDDHGLHMVGYLHKNNHDWYLVKDSSRSGQRGVPGYYFYRDDYVKLKVLDFLVHKDAVKEYLTKFETSRITIK